MNYLITFEGIEGVGKSTQIKLLHDFIIKSGYSSQIIREPGSTPFGEDIRNILLNSNHNITKEAELLLMFASRSALVDSILTNQDTDFVLCDRFYDASIAYQGYGRGLDLNIIEALIEHTKCPIPDLTFLLDLDPELGFKRKSSDKMDRIESSGLTFFNNVREGYLKQADKNKSRIKVIDASKDLNVISNEIIDEFNKII